MMSRQDFIALSEALLSVKKDVSSEQVEKMRDAIICAITMVCQASNSSFDKRRFLAACNGAPYNPPRRRRREPVHLSPADMIQQAREAMRAEREANR